MSSDSKIIIAIDGYSSSGKSTMARQLASAIGYRYIDSGAMYRAVTLWAMRHGYVSPGVKSSNGKVLFKECLDVNPRTYLVSGSADFDPAWIDGASSVGICGATSTPRWLMEQVRDTVMNHLSDRS